MAIYSDTDLVLSWGKRTMNKPSWMKLTAPFCVRVCNLTVVRADAGERAAVGIAGQSQSVSAGTDSNGKSV
jgi:hypothetical protein